MGDTSIEWAEKSWNPLRARNVETGGVGHYCEKVSPGCAGCYAERMQKRFKNKIRYNAADRGKVELFLDGDVLADPLRWRAPKKVFPCSMTDIFGEWVPDEWLLKIFTVMAQPLRWAGPERHVYQVLTKRADRARDFMSRLRWLFGTAGGGPWRMEETGDRPLNPIATLDGRGDPTPAPHIWLGVSVENQKEADERIPHLLQTPAAVRWLSIEPLLGPIDLGNPKADDTESGDYSMRIQRGLFGINWVVVGGESGPGARPMHPDWARSLRDQCAGAGVPFFFKQWGAWMPLPEPFRYRPAIGSGNREYNQALRRFARAHGASRLIAADRPEGWQKSAIDRGEALIDGWAAIGRVGKKRAGRQLDGRTWDEMPEAAR